MAENIGFPDEFTDPEHLEEMYSHVSSVAVARVQSQSHEFSRSRADSVAVACTQTPLSCDQILVNVNKSSTKALPAKDTDSRHHIEA